MKLIPLTQGKFAMVDDDVFEELNKFKWHAAKTSRCRVVAGRNAPGPKRGTILMHRVIMNALPGQEVDHKDGNPLNNTRANLRIVNHAGQQRGFISKFPGCSSEFRGVSWDKRLCMWKAHIWQNGRYYWLGRFANESDAAKAFDKKAREFGWPEYGLNFPHAS